MRHGLDHVKRSWHAFGKEDPFWAALTEPGKRGGGWNEEEFFRTGDEDVERILGVIGAHSISIPRRRALDFGCAAGRLTQALATRFESVIGLDIAPSMIAAAERFNRHGAQYMLNRSKAPDLSLLNAWRFDFILSLLVLQHNRPEAIVRYVAEFIRLLSAEGVAVFNVPHARMGPEPPSWIATPPSGLRAVVPECMKRPLRRWLRRSDHPPAPVMEMHAIPRERMEREIASMGGTVLDVLPVNWAKGWTGFLYYVRRRGGAGRS